MVGRQVSMSTPRFWLVSLAYLMASMLVSIIQGEQSFEAGVRALIDVDMGLRALYIAVKILLGAGYLRWVGHNLWQIALLIAFALGIRMFAEGTFTIVLIGAAMAWRLTKQDA